jgi:hypothetical protein
MSIKFFKGGRDVYKFDPESLKSFIYRAGGWQELKTPEHIEEIRYRTVELSLAEAARRFGAEPTSSGPAACR